MSHNTSAQDAPVASQEAEARYVVRFREDPWQCCELVDTVTGSVIADDGGEPEDRNLYRDFAPLVAELNRVAHLLTSERERYAALLSALISSCFESDDWGGYCFFCGGEHTLDYEGYVHDYLDHKVDCPWVEARIALAASEEAGSE